MSLLISFGLLTALFYFFWVLPFWGYPFNAQRHGRPPLTPAWALECWLWEDDHGTAARVDELLSGYKEHDIPVRTIILDSPWSTRYNDFNIDTTRYPQPQKWLTKLEADGYRVVLWMTCMVNSFSKDTFFQDSHAWYETAHENGYLAGDGYQWSWWKGNGGFIDYTNPDAMRWWRSLQQQVFDYGIDGWKLDGTATFFSSRIGDLPLPYQKTHAGLLTTRGYMDHYYRDEYFHGLSQNPEFVTLARAIDMPWAHPEGFAPIDAAPVTWVGDQEHTWSSSETLAGEKSPNKDLKREVNQGIEEAIRYILKSARIGYNIIGSDVGGYSGSIIPPRLYIRWAQFSTFCGLFMNGGHGERALCKRSPQELEIIRKFSWLHTELVPYSYSYVVSGHHGAPPLMRPTKGLYHYMFGDALLVAPVFQDTLSRAVQLPRGSWRYFFDDQELLQGPQIFTRDFPLDEYPVFIKNGSIIPLAVEREYTGFGDRSSQGYTTWLIYPAGENQFTLYHPDSCGVTTVRVVRTPEEVTVSLSGVQTPHILRLFLDKPPRAVFQDERPLFSPHDWIYDVNQKKLIIKTEIYQNGFYRLVLDPAAELR